MRAQVLLIPKKVTTVRTRSAAARCAGFFSKRTGLVPIASPTPSVLPTRHVRRSCEVGSRCGPEHTGDVSLPVPRASRCLLARFVGTFAQKAAGTVTQSLNSEGKKETLC